MKRRIFHFAFKTEFRSGIVREIITPAKIKSPEAIQDVQKTNWMDVKALWDTGATNTVITRTVVDRLGFLPTGRTIVHGVNSTDEVNTYYVDILLPNNVRIRMVRVTECELNSPGIDLLVGMNIIQLGDLAISNGTGHTIFSFAYPPFPKPLDLLARAEAVNPKGRR
jgi:hypothetical protein